MTSSHTAYSLPVVVSLTPSLLLSPLLPPCCCLPYSLPVVVFLTPSLLLSPLLPPCCSLLTPSLLLSPLLPPCCSLPYSSLLLSPYSSLLLSPLLPPVVVSLTPSLLLSPLLPPCCSLPYSSLLLSPLLLLLFSPLLPPCCCLPYSLPVVVSLTPSLLFSPCSPETCSGLVQLGTECQRHPHCWTNQITALCSTEDGQDVEGLLGATTLTTQSLFSGREADWTPVGVAGQAGGGATHVHH